MVYYPKISTSIGLSWDDFHIFLQSETWTHPPASIVILFFYILFSFAKPLND